MSELQSVSRPFASKGVILKLDPSLIPEDGYQELTNLVSDIEGNLTTRNGNQRLTAQGDFAASNGIIHTITRLRLGGPANTVTRYLAQGGIIWGSNQPLPTGGANMPFVQLATGASKAVPYGQQRIGTADYASGASGAPYKFFAATAAMLKSNGSLTPLLRWGILPPFEPASAATTGSGTGPPAFTGAEVPYTYVYTNYNSTTRAESNPSVVTVTAGVTPDGSAINVTIAGSNDPQVNQLRVYRAGGAFADGLYRLLGTIANPGSSSAAVFIDFYLDQNITIAPLLQTDNDPPVPSTLPIPVLANVTAFNGGAQTGPGVYALSLDPNMQGNLALVTPGSSVTVRDFNNGTQEQSTVITVDAVNLIVTVFLQLAYRQSQTAIFIDTAAGSPANITLAAFDSIFVAGDANNPHVLYKSKNGQPESFGVLENSTGITDAINVGTPSDPIRALVEYGGGVISLNLESIFYIAVFQGAMATPSRQPARRGLIATAAWCRVANEIWYLSYDGIYAYAGGQEVWLTEQIDPLFHGLTVGNYLPIDLRQGLGNAGADVITMGCTGQEVFVTYLDSHGNPARLRYHDGLKRWSVETISDTLSPGPAVCTAQFVEGDTGNQLISKNLLAVGEGFLYLDDTGTTDGWVTSVTDGQSIPYAVQPAAISAPAPDNRLYSDISVEVSNPFDPVDLNVYYDYSVTEDLTDVFVLPTTGIRHREPFSLHQSQGVEAYALTPRLFGIATHKIVLYSISTNYWPRARFTIGQAFDWDDCGYPNEKTFRVLNIELDTGGTTASIVLQCDGLPFSNPIPITTTSLDRNRIVTLPDNMMARLVRMVIVTGAGGKVNYYKHSWEFIKEPPAVTFWDSFQIAPYDGLWFIKQVWLQYMAGANIVVTFYNDANVQFYSLTLPAHPIPLRAMERFYLPAVVGTILNKSRVKRITITSSDGVTAFRIYANGSRIEWWACGEGQRAGYQQMPFNQMIQPQAA